MDKVIKFFSQAQTGDTVGISAMDVHGFEMYIGYIVEENFGGFVVNSQYGSGLFLPTEKSILGIETARIVLVEKNVC